MIKVLGVLVIILLIDWKIYVIFIISFTLILIFSIKHLSNILKQEELLDKHSETTQSLTSELITNIRTVKRFSTERRELIRQYKRLDRELKYILFRIHKEYLKLVTWQKTVIQSSVFLILVYSLIITV